MSYGTSDTTVISSTKTEARNLNAIDASAAQRDDSSPAPKNRQEEPYSVRIVRLYETKRVTSEIHGGKAYNRNKQALFKDQNATIKYMVHI